MYGRKLVLVKQMGDPNRPIQLAFDRIPIRAGRYRRIRP